MTDGEEPESLGERLRRYRLSRGFTQEGLALHAAVSVDLVSKLEQGTKKDARLTTFRSLADALDIPLSELVDRRPRVGQVGDPLVLSIRDAVFAPAAILPEVEAGESAPVAVVGREVDAVWRAYWTGRFDVVAARLPALIAEARQTSASGGEGAATPLSQVLQLTGYLMIHFGREDVAGAALDQAVRVANDSPDRWQWAHAAGAMAHLQHAGLARPATTVPLALRIADEIEPGDDAPEADVALWGSTLITALAAAGAAGDADTVRAITPAAVVAANRLGQDQTHRHVLYGPAALGMQLVYAALQLGDPAGALQASTDVRVEDLRPISRSRFLLDVAVSLTMLGKDAEALQVLTQAAAISPVWFRHMPQARMLLQEIAQRQARMSGALRDLVRLTEDN